MDANFERARGKRRWIDRKLMEGEWPVLLRIMGKGEGDQRYLSVAEVRTLFVERRLPERINARLRVQTAPAGRLLGRLVKAAIALIAIIGAAFVAIAEFPDEVGQDRAAARAIAAAAAARPRPDESCVLARPELVDRRPALVPPCEPGHRDLPGALCLVCRAGTAGHSSGEPARPAQRQRLSRTVRFPPQSEIHPRRRAALRRFGYAPSPDAKTEPAPDDVFGLRPTAVENFDGLPVGFARLTGVANPGTGQGEPDRIGLTCAACHTGSIRYKGISVRFDGGPAMVELRKLESATGLSILYTLKVPGRFGRFAARVLGSGASQSERDKLKTDLAAVGDYLLNQKQIYDKTIKAKGQKDTDEGFGRLDALNRIGNQVFYTDLALGGLSGLENNLHADDAPVSFPPIWTVPWFWWAQYDASIEQPLIRNAGEALGVSALINLSPDHPPEALFRSSVALENLVRIEAMLRGADPFGREPKSFGGLTSPKWPSQLFPDDPAWKIRPERVAKGRAIYAEICVECHLGPVNDPAFDAQFPDKSFWSSKQWDRDPRGAVLNPVEKGAAGMGTDPAQSNVLALRQVEVPGFLNLQPAEDLGTQWKCRDLPTFSSTEMPFAIALMIVVDKVSQEMDEGPRCAGAGAHRAVGPAQQLSQPRL